MGNNDYYDYLGLDKMDETGKPIRVEFPVNYSIDDVARFMENNKEISQAIKTYCDKWTSNNLINEEPSRKKLLPDVHSTRLFQQIFYKYSILKYEEDNLLNNPEYIANLKKLIKPLESLLSFDKPIENIFPEQHKHLSDLLPSTITNDSLSLLLTWAKLIVNKHSIAEKEKTKNNLKSCSVFINLLLKLLYTLQKIKPSKTTPATIDSYEGKEITKYTKKQEKLLVFDFIKDGLHVIGISIDENAINEMIKKESKNINWDEDDVTLKRNVCINPQDLNEVIKSLEED